MSKLSILHFSDTHNKHTMMRYKLTKPVDVAVFSGDLSGIGSRTEVENFIDWYLTFPAYHRIFIAGNHDLCFDPYRGFNNGDTPQWLKDEIQRFEIADPNHNIYLENSGCEIHGVKFWGSPITPWFYGEYWAFNRQRGVTNIGEVWKHIPVDADVIITHGPVFGIHDLVERGERHVGCEVLDYHVKLAKPLLHLCGHIHEGYGYEYRGVTHYFNGSILNLQYEVTNEPWHIEADFEEREVKILNYARKDEATI